MNGLTVFCIYKNPADFPDKFVVRRWEGMDPAPRPEFVEDTLEGVRTKLTTAFPGLVRLERHKNDDPVILETWL